MEEETCGGGEARGGDVRGINGGDARGTNVKEMSVMETRVVHGAFKRGEITDIL